MFEIGRQALADCKRIAVVGDNLASDIAGAKRSRLEAILVLTGIATEPDLIARRAPAGSRAGEPGRPCRRSRGNLEGRSA
jgi:ribonucleotide monophosphatase NagD (HAD superfamily)